MYVSPGEERKNLAYHEAAHAVAFYHAGLQINYVHVSAQGRINVEWPHDPDASQAMALAVGCLAGPYSWYVLHGEEIPNQPLDDFLQEPDDMAALAAFSGSNVEELRAMNPSNHGEDNVDALEMLRIAESTCGGLERCYERMLERVKQGLVEWWPEIRTLADRLFVTGFLSGDECVALIESAKKGEE
jgi:hypothetical protein